LKRLETDGTFDQLKPIERLLANKEYTDQYFSFDLSAATDRLPVELQRDILEMFTSK
jgi:hypothetical protein